MYLKDNSIYISGICKMASFNIGPSYMDAYCFNKKDYMKELSKMFNFSEEKVELKEVNIKFYDLMKELLFLPEKALDTFVYLIEKEVGNSLKIYTSESPELHKALSSEDGNIGVFYFLEDVYFVEFEKEVICFMIGNFE